MQGLDRNWRQESGRGVVMAARAGYAAKGLVYSTLGALSLMFAAGEAGGKLTDSEGALDKLGSQPFGTALLWVTSIGLLCYALWCLVLALLNPEHHRSDAKGVLKRLGLIFSALTHAALAVYGAQAAYGASGPKGNGTESWAAKALSMPAGEVLLALAGLIAVGFGVYQLYRAVKNEPEGTLERNAMSATMARFALSAGRFGQAARGLVFPLIGISLIVAALRSDPDEANDMGEALGELLRAPFGSVLLVIVAAGLFAYGLYQGVLARYAVLPDHV
jgi:hypothetical protein